MDINLSNAMAVPGWCSIPEIQWLAQQAQGRKNILEIGSWKGKSTRAMADNSTAHITIVDPFIEDYLSGGNTRNAFEQNMREHIQIGKVTIMHMTSDDAAIILKAKKAKFDMIFIDGEHWYEFIERDINNYWPMLERGGLFCGHDYTPGEECFRDNVCKCVHDLTPKGFKVTIPVDRIWVYEKEA